MSRISERWLSTLLSVQLLLGAGVALDGCTLDFDEFSDYTEPQPEPEKEKDGALVADAEIVDAEADMSVDADEGDEDSQVLPNDIDGDGVPDDVDNCVAVPNPGQEDSDHNGVGDACEADPDGDGVLSEVDNCPTVANPDQADLDGDGLGDACDPDIDGDGLSNAQEEAMGLDPRNPDMDGDGILDGEDFCPLVPDMLNLDLDGDGVGDVCDLDADGDGVLDSFDNCPRTANADQSNVCADDLDGDGIRNLEDNCPTRANPDQSVRLCETVFKSLPYTRDVRALSEDGTAAATGGGAWRLNEGHPITLTMADGLASNDLLDVAVDDAGGSWFVAEGAVIHIRADGFVLNHMVGVDGPKGKLTSVAVQGGTIYVGSSAGLNLFTREGWRLLNEGTLARGVNHLYASGSSQIWAATSDGIDRFEDGARVSSVEAIAGMGAVEAMSAGAEGTTWIFFADKAVQLNASDEVVAQVAVSHGKAAVAHRDETLFASSEGIVRLDSAGRLYPAGATMFPSKETRDLAVRGGSTVVAATAGGVIEFDGVLALFDGQQIFGTNCVWAANRIDGHLWVGTDQGLFIQGDEGMEPVTEGNINDDVRVIKVIDGEVYVGWARGVAVFDRTGAFLRSLSWTTQSTYPVTDVEAGVNGDLWIATKGNGFWRIPVEGEPVQFTKELSGARILSDTVTSLAHNGEMLFAGTTEGICKYDEIAHDLYQPTGSASNLPSSNIRDLVFEEGHLYVATAQGAARRDVASNGTELWNTYSPSVGSWGVSGGGSDVGAVAVDGANLWMVTNAANPRVLRRGLGADATDTNATIVLSPIELANPVNAYVAELPLQGTDGVSLEWAENHLLVSYCGKYGEQGGLSDLDGSGLVRQNFMMESLPSPGDETALTLDIDGNLLWTRRVEKHLESFSRGDAGFSSMKLPASWADNANGWDLMITECEPGQEGGDLWCVFKGIGVAHRTEAGSWKTYPYTSYAGMDSGEVRAFAQYPMKETDLKTRFFLAMPNGLFELDANAGTFRLYANGQSGATMSANDTTAVEVTPSGRVYIGTASGVTSFDGETRDDWLIFDNLPSERVNAMALYQDHLYVAFDSGVYHINTQNESVEKLLNHNAHLLAVYSDGRLVVSGSEGLFIMDGTGSFSSPELTQSMSGHETRSLVIDKNDVLYVENENGVYYLE